MNKFLLFFLIQIGLAGLISLITGFNIVNFLNTLFMIALPVFCISLLIMMFSQGAFSIMGHSFRKFSYIMTPKRIKEQLPEDEHDLKDLHIRNEQYAFTMPLVITSMTLTLISLVLSFLVSS